MSYPQFPLELGVTQREGFSVTYRDDQNARDLRGPFSMRNRSVMHQAALPVRMVWNPIAFAIFESFFRIDLKNGVRWFEWFNVFGDGLTRGVRIDGGCQVSMLARSAWGVTFSIIVDRPYLLPS